MVISDWKGKGIETPTSLCRHICSLHVRKAEVHLTASQSAPGLGAYIARLMRRYWQVVRNPR